MVLNSQQQNIDTDIKFGDGYGPNLCRVKKVDVVPYLLKIYFGLGWPSSVLGICFSHEDLKKKIKKFNFLEIWKKKFQSTKSKMKNLGKFEKIWNID